MSSDRADPENTRDSFDICTVKRVSLIWNYKCESWIFKRRIFFWFSVYNIITISSLLLISERDMWWLIIGTRSRRNEKWTRFHANDSISKYFCNLISWIGRFNLYIWTKERFGKNESAGDLNFFLSKLNKVASHTDTAADDSNLKNKPENRAWMYSPIRGDR